MERRRRFTASKIVWSVTLQKAEYTPQTPNTAAAIAAGLFDVGARGKGTLITADQR
jgi:hypothetical protein